MEDTDSDDRRPGTVRERFSALVTDHLIIGYLLFGGIIAFFYVTGRSPTHFFPWLKENRFLIATAGGAFYFLYFFCFEGVVTATPGKLLAGLSLRKKGGETPSIFAILIRNLFRLVDYPLFPLIGAGLVEGTKNQQRLGDLLAGTILTKKKKRVLQQGEIPYAGTVRRGVAFLLDLVLILTFTYGLLFALTPDKKPATLLLLNLVPLALLFYLALSEFLFHTTFGKEILGLKVLSEEATAPSFATVTLRNLFLPLDINPLSYLLVLLTRQKQRLGDLFAGSIVIRSWKGWQSSLAIPFMLFVAIGVGFLGYQNKKNFLTEGEEVRVGSFPLPLIPNVVARYTAPSLQLEKLTVGSESGSPESGSPEPGFVVFKPGDRVSLNMEVVGFKVEKGEGQSARGQFARAWIQVDVAVRDPFGNTILNQSNLLNGSYTVDWRRLIPLSARFALHPMALTGNYEAFVTVRDPFGGGEVRESRSFRVGY